MPPKTWQCCCRGDGSDAACGAAVGSHPAAAEKEGKISIQEPAQHLHRDTAPAVCACTDSSSPDGCPLLWTGLSMGTAHQGHGPLPHPFTAPKNIPWHTPSPPVPSPQRPSSLSFINHKLLSAPPRKRGLVPHVWAAGWDGGCQDRLCPSVCPSVRPAAALLRALTSALPAAGRWAGGTAPIVLKIIQRSTNSLQISVTASRN